MALVLTQFTSVVEPSSVALDGLNVTRHMAEQQDQWLAASAHVTQAVDAAQQITDAAYARSQLNLDGLNVAREMATQQDQWLAAMTQADQSNYAVRQVADVLNTRYQIGTLADQLAYHSMSSIAETCRFSAVDSLLDEVERWRNEMSAYVKHLQPPQSLIDTFSSSPACSELGDFASKELLTRQVCDLHHFATDLVAADYASFGLPDYGDAMRSIAVPPMHATRDLQSAWQGRVALLGDIGTVLPLAQTHADITLARLAQDEIGRLGVFSSIADYLKSPLGNLPELVRPFVGTSYFEEIDQGRSIVPQPFAADSSGIDDDAAVRGAIVGPDEVTASDAGVSDPRAATHLALAALEFFRRIVHLTSRISPCAAVDCTAWLPQFMLVLSAAEPLDRERLRIAFALFEERRVRLSAPRGSIHGGAGETLTTEDIEEFDEAAEFLLMALDSVARKLH
jgi:hypothetical protein